LFRRTDAPATSEPPHPPAPQKEALVLRESHGDLNSHVLSSGVIPLKAAKGVRPPRDRDIPLSAPPKVSAPPELPAVFDRSLAASVADDPRGVAALARLEAMASLSSSSTIPQGPAPLRTHRIVDGDTLARLAERFLGDANRYEEIYALNESELPNPNILPIGVELKIPPREGSLSLQTAAPASVAPAEVEQRQASIDPLSPLGDSGGLVPVPAGEPHE
jgi:hypothetical protein